MFIMPIWSSNDALEKKRKICKVVFEVLPNILRKIKYLGTDSVG